MRSSRDSLEHLKKMLYSHCQHFFETNQIAAAHATYSRTVEYVAPSGYQWYTYNGGVWYV